MLILIEAAVFFHLFKVNQDSFNFSGTTVEYKCCDTVGFYDQMHLLLLLFNAGAHGGAVG